MNRRVALTVGVDTYEDSQLATLRCAVRDAAEMAAFLKYRAGYDRVEQLVSSVTDDQVVDTAVRLAGKLEAGDLFLFYFSGHGIEYAGRHLLLCPKAQYARLQYYRQTVPIDQLRDETASAGADRVFILDACRTNPVAGKGVGSLRGEVVLRDVVTHAPVRTGGGCFGMMCSCSEGEQAGELAGRQNGLFTAALLSVLETRAAAGQSVCLDDDLRVSVAREMAALGTQEGVWHTQTPWHQSSGPAIPVLIPARCPAAQPGSQPSSATLGPRPVRVGQGEATDKRLLARQETRCGSCDARIVSELGIAGRCQVCQAPLCAGCFQIQKIDRCRAHREPREGTA